MKSLIFVRDLFFCVCAWFFGGAKQQRSGLSLLERRNRRGHLRYWLKESHLKWGWLTRDRAAQLASNERNEKKEKEEKKKKLIGCIESFFTLRPAEGLDGAGVMGLGGR